MRRYTSLFWLAISATVAAVGCNESSEALQQSSLQGEPLPGAIFTTTVDGSRVNANIYGAKEDVYLDGGPGQRAPSSAAALPEGDYYFQVTDPSGKDLLSTDHISCRKFRVSEEGLIDLIYPSETNYVWSHGAWQQVNCKHGEGTDQDHSALTVQLFPYDNTPNNGGVYKVWVTRVGDYQGDKNFIPTNRQDQVNGELYAAGYYHGFVPSSSKTDNFKVRGRCDPDLLSLRKFHDPNMNGVFDPGEEEITGWSVRVFDPLGSDNYHLTPALVLASQGLWITREALPEKGLQTSAYLDGVLMSLYPAADPEVSVEFVNQCQERHEVLYGNVGEGWIRACKFFDNDDKDPIAGWPMTLTGADVTGASVGPITLDTEDNNDDGNIFGCVDFQHLLPGTYTVTEALPIEDNWYSILPISVVVQVESILTQTPDGPILVGSEPTVSFTNGCTGLADFSTKGYWHNKNGLIEMTSEDIRLANGLAPYATPSSYFDRGDEPFDGSFKDGTPVETALGDSGEDVAPAGSAKAEVSLFLVDKNATGDPREQLAQQLLAFFFNTMHRLGSPEAAIEFGGDFIAADQIIAEAIEAWLNGSPEEQNAWTGRLDAMNNSDAIRVVSQRICPFTF
jgi:hypothetical protein